MYIFSYDENLAKQNRCTYKISFVILLTTFLVILSVIVGIVLLFAVPDSMWLGVVLMLFGVISTTIFVSNYRIKYGNAKQTAFALENNVLYKVMFLGTNIPIAGGSVVGVIATAHNFQNQINSANNARNHDMIYNAIQSHKFGNSSYNPFFGSGTQVQEMHGLVIVKETAKYWKCEFTDEKNIKRHITITKSYNNNFYPNNFTIL